MIPLSFPKSALSHRHARPKTPRSGQEFTTRNLSEAYRTSGCIRAALAKKHIFKCEKKKPDQSLPPSFPYSQPQLRQPAAGVLQEKPLYRRLKNFLWAPSPILSDFTKSRSGVPQTEQQEAGKSLFSRAQEAAVEKLPFSSLFAQDLIFLKNASAAQKSLFCLAAPGNAPHSLLA